MNDAESMKTNYGENNGSGTCDDGLDLKLCKRQVAVKTMIRALNVDESGDMHDTPNPQVLTGRVPCMSSSFPSNLVTDETKTKRGHNCKAFGSLLFPSAFSSLMGGAKS